MYWPGTLHTVMLPWIIPNYHSPVKRTDLISCITYELIMNTKLQTQVLTVHTVVCLPINCTQHKFLQVGQAVTKPLETFQHYCIPKSFIKKRFINVLIINIVIWPNLLWCKASNMLNQQENLTAGMVGPVNICEQLLPQKISHGPTRSIFCVGNAQFCDAMIWNFH